MFTNDDLYNLKKYASTLCVCIQDAEDLVQDSIIVYLEKKSNIKNLKQIKKYCSPVIYYLNKNRLRIPYKKYRDYTNYSNFAIPENQYDYITEQEIKNFSETLPKLQKQAFIYTLAFNDHKEACEYLDVDYEAFRRSWRVAMLKWKEHAYGI